MKSSRVDAVFVVSPGRSGTDYLASLFDAIPACDAYHEPQPVCNARAMRNFLSGDDALMRDLVQEKCRHICDTIQTGKIYVETNHCFIKGYGWLLPCMLPDLRLGVITLRRNSRRIADSFQRLRITPLSKDGPMWLMTPETTQPSSIPCPGGQHKRSLYHVLRMTSWVRERLRLSQQCSESLDYQYLRWGALETRVWGRRYQQSHPHYAYHSATLEHLNTVQGVRRMLDAMGLPWHTTIAARLGIRRNLKRQPRQLAA